jgi:hypothetical protein
VAWSALVAKLKRYKAEIVVQLRQETAANRPTGSIRRRVACRNRRRATARISAKGEGTMNQPLLRAPKNAAVEEDISLPKFGPKTVSHIRHHQMPENALR